MHTDFAIAPARTGAGGQVAGEKVGVRRIRLTLPSQCLSAHVGTFFSADKMLLQWATRCGGALQCGFEIVYDDGHILAGEYAFRRSRAIRPALIAFLRRTVEAACNGSGDTSALRGLSDRPHSFLERYEIDDFTLP